MKKSSLVFLFAAAMLLTGCSEYSQSGYKPSSGITVTPEIIESVSDSVFKDEAAANATVADMYYWTEGGGKYHLYSGCSALSRSDGVKCGSGNEAVSAGKLEMCSKCAKKVGLETPGTLAGGTPEQQTTDVPDAVTTAAVDSVTASKPSDSTLPELLYWTTGGEKYHIYVDCSSLSRSSKIESGDYSTAADAGKREMCAICAKKFGTTLPSPLETGTDLTTTSSVQPDRRVFWTENGEVFHYYYDCRYLAESIIKSGTMYEAARAGMGRVCSGCADRFE